MFSLGFFIPKGFIANTFRRFWPFSFSIQFYTFPFVLICVPHNNTPSTGCPVKGVHIIGGRARYSPLFFVRQVISYCLNDIEGESACFNCGGNNQELLLHHCPVGINDWSHVSVGNETQYEAVMSRIQGLSIGIVIVTTILLILRVVLVLYISGAG